MVTVFGFSSIEMGWETGYVFASLREMAFSVPAAARLVLVLLVRPTLEIEFLFELEFLFCGVPAEELATLWPTLLVQEVMVLEELTSCHRAEDALLQRVDQAGRLLLWVATFTHPRLLLAETVSPRLCLR